MKGTMMAAMFDDVIEHPFPSNDQDDHTHSNDNISCCIRCGVYSLFIKIACV